MTKTKVLWSVRLNSRTLIGVEWCIKDMWVGLYWNKRNLVKVYDFYICIIPCLPIHIIRFQG